jgi:hypothetical protein
MITQHCETCDNHYSSAGWDDDARMCKECASE